MTEKFPGLDTNQSNKVTSQIEAHNHGEYVTVRTIAGKNIEITVLPTILRPEAMASTILTDYLNNLDFTGKEVIDIGTGTGIQGITMALNGASLTIVTDITNQAIENAQLNVGKLHIPNSIQVLKSDLFETIDPNQMFDVIVFNHPFFPTKPIVELPQTIAMFDEGNLLVRFFTDAKKHLKPGGKIIMPYFSLAGETNDPGVQAGSYGYKIAEEQVYPQGVGLQDGEIKIYTLVL